MGRPVELLALAVFLAAGPAAAATLPPEVPVPAGVAADQVSYRDYDQDVFTYPNGHGNAHDTVPGHLWRAFLKGATPAAWKAALAGKGWSVVSDDPGNLVARQGDWWLRIQGDRLLAVQHADAAPFSLPAPAAAPEALAKDRDVPYATPLPKTTLKVWKTTDFIEVKAAGQPEEQVFGPAVSLRYVGYPELTPLEINTRYRRALEASGWQIFRSDAAGMLIAHYVQHGRDVWLRVTPADGADYFVEVADMQAAVAPSKLAKAFDDAGHVALYGTDKATLRPDSEATLQQILQFLGERPALKVEIQGHTDNVGPRPHNQTLSEDRAAAVRAWLVAHHVDPARLVTRGYADTRPVADNGTPVGRARNRRVELARP
jgi:outer membrane protein OmpA-like peptidoglycan-associated protein